MKKFIRLQILFLLTFSNLFAGEIGKELPPPVAGFTVSNNQGGLPNQGCGPLEITFTSTSISPGDPIVSYEWTFGDGTVLTTNDHTVTHTYTTGGKFEASLTITTSSLATSKYDYPYNIYVNVPNLGPDREFCMNEFGEEATFISSSTDGSFHTVWNDGYIGVARNLQAPGIYWVEATDQANGCSRRDTVIITAKPLVDVKYGYTELSNCGGAVTLRFVDSTKFNTDCGGPLPTSVNYLSEIMSGPAHVYEGSTDQNPEYTFTTEGTYEIWLGIEDGLDWHDYIMSVDIVFADANPPTAPTFTNQTICAGGSVALDAGYELGVTYSWLPTTGLSNPNIHNPVASPGSTQTYTVTKTKCGNSVTGSVTVTVGQPFTVDLGGDRQFCKTQFTSLSTGITDATSTSWGSDGDPTFASRGGSSSMVGIIPNTPGNYWVTVVKDGCTVSDTINISIVNSVLVNLSYSQPDACFPNRVQFNSDPGTSSSCGLINQYKWDFGDGTVVSYGAGAAPSERNPLHIYASPGTYNVRLVVFNDIGDSTEATTVVNVAAPGFDVNLGNDATICAADMITLDAGDFPGATYLWSTGESTQTIQASTAGEYWVEVTVGACSSRDTVEITVAPALDVDLGADASICSGSSITLDAGEFPGADYSWSTGESTRTISVNAAGTYMVTVTRNGCSASDSKDITVNTVPVVDLGADASICSGSSITLDAGEFPGADYSWSTGESTRTISVNAAGTYTVTVTQNGCSASDSKDITVNAVPVVDLGADASICSGSSITLDAGDFPGADYSWSTGESTRTISVNAAGTYTVTVTQNGCSASDSKDITENAVPVVDLGADASICSGSSITLDAGDFPGADYSWSTGESTRTISVNSAGTYMVTVTRNGCSASDSKDITVNTVPVVDLGADASICSGSSITLDAGEFPGADYSWSTGESTRTISVSAAGTYMVTVTRNGCSASDSKDITVNTVPVVDLGADASICSGSSITLDAGDFPGADYSWSTGESTRTISVSAAGTYTVTVTRNGCSASDSKVISVATLSVDLGEDILMCKTGGFAVLKTGITGAQSTTWGSDADPSFAGRGLDKSTNGVLPGHPGKYWVAVVKGGCTARDTVNIGLKDGITVEFTSQQVTSCYPYKVQFNSDPSTFVTCGSASIYRWDFGDGTIASYTTSIIPGQRNPEHEYQLPGTYNVRLTVVNSNDDSASYTLPVVVTGSGAAVDLGDDVTICSGTTLTLDAGEFTGATYEWSNGSTNRTLQVTESGNYRVFVTVGGCTTSDDINVTVVDSGLPVDLGNDTTVCVGSTITLDAGYPGATYLWSNGATTQTISPSVTENTVFTVAVSRDGCSGNGEIRVNVTNQLPVTLGEDVTLCVGESLVLDAGHSGADYLWHDGVATQTRTVTAPGEYSVTVTDGGCSGTASIQITMLEAPAEVDLGSDTTLCFGNTLVLDAGHPGATYLWSTGATTQTIMVSASGTYSVDVTACGTTVSGSIQVTASSAPAPSISLSGNELIASTADTYQWYKDGQLIPGATAKKLKPKGYGNYTVQVGSSDCVGEASYFFVPSGEIYLGDIRVKVTPNPSYGQPKLILSKLPGKPVQVSVFDRIGRKVLLTHIVNTVNELNLTGLARGEYFAELVLDDKRVIVKIITQ